MINYVRVKTRDYFGKLIEYEGFLDKIQATTYQGIDEDMHPILWDITLIDKNTGVKISNISINDLRKIEFLGKIGVNKK